MLRIRYSLLTFFVAVRSAGADVCMLYMPTIDLWAVEAYNKVSEDDYEPSSVSPQSSREKSCDGRFEVDMEHEPCPGSNVERSESQTEEKEASYLWTSFIEQVESIRVNTSLIILVRWLFSVMSLKFEIKL